MLFWCLVRFRLPSFRDSLTPAAEDAALTVSKEFAPAGLISFPFTGGESEQFARYDLGKGWRAAGGLSDGFTKTFDTHKLPPMPEAFR